MPLPAPPPLDPTVVQKAVQAALAEDIGPGDATTLALIPADLQARASLVARQTLVLSGLDLACTAFLQLAPHLHIERHAQDGQTVPANTSILSLTGPARALLTGERVALNFLQHLSGIATLTARFVTAIEGTPARILDTRKTIPGLRSLAKYAVLCGGGSNHRLGLHDAILIKDNHLAALANNHSDPVRAAIQLATSVAPGLPLEVEADSLDQVDSALAAGAPRILLDNMDTDTLREAVRRCANRATTEASGGVTLATVRDIALCGVNFISIGALTHSAPAADLALDFHPEPHG